MNSNNQPKPQPVDYDKVVQDMLNAGDSELDPDMQPKPQSDEGLILAGIAKAACIVFETIDDGPYLDEHKAIIKSLAECIGIEGDDNALEKQFYEIAALSRQAPVPTPSDEDLAVRIAELARNMRDKPYEDLAAAIEPMLVIPAPVPTSGAVEVAREIEHVEGVLYRTADVYGRVAAIIQQYGDRVQQSDWQAGYDAALAAQPPAADGKLREALEFYADPECYKPQERTGCPVRGTIQLQSDIQRDNHGDKARAALAQPASGGGA